MSKLERITLPDFPGLPAVFSHAVKYPASASLIACSGQIHAQGAGMTLTEGTVAEKTKVIIDGLEKVLVAGGSSLSQLVKVNIYITDFAIFNEMNETYIKMIPDPKPARTCVCVKALPFGASIEIEATGWAK